jgi:hypothetical protein
VPTKVPTAVPTATLAATVTPAPTAVAEPTATAIPLPTSTPARTPAPQPAIGDLPPGIWALLIAIGGMLCLAAAVFVWLRSRRLGGTPSTDGKSTATEEREPALMEVGARSGQEPGGSESS